MAPKITLTILDGSWKEKSFDFSGRYECSIGRSSNDCYIQLPGDKSDGYTGVSGKHCILEIEPPHVKIKSFPDKKTSVNGRSIGSSEFETITFSGSEGEMLALGKDNVRIRINLVHNRVADAGKVIKRGVGTISPGFKDWVNWLLKIELPQQSETQPQQKKQPVSDTDLGEQPLTAQTGTQPAKDERSPEIRQSALPKIREYKIIQRNESGKLQLAETTTGKKVAIKALISGTKSNPKDTDRFIREMDNIKKLSHQNIIKSIDWGVQDSTLYYVMEYCEVGDLDRTIDQMGGKLPLDLARSIILQVLDGLDYLHHVKIDAKTEEDGYQEFCGIVHRNLEPKSILLTIDKLNLVAKIGNFGLSKSFDNAAYSGITSVEDPGLGSHPFLSRQQLKDYRNSKPEVDIWAAAACLYCMLTGEYPRDFYEDVDFNTSVLEQPAIAIKIRNPDIPDSLAEVIDRALREDKELHYKTAKDFKRDLLSSFEQIATQSPQLPSNDDSGNSDKDYWN
jgi:eukaryotic-like serine/threonine-protein kinase